MPSLFALLFVLGAGLEIQVAIAVVFCMFYLYLPCMQLKFLSI
jgi:hypothetical protein